jgi:predicted nucleic acid-binding protein
VARVIDANLLVELARSGPWAALADQLIRQSVAAGEELHAPQLAPYEVASGLTLSVAAGALPRGELGEALARLAEIALTLHPPGPLGVLVETALAQERSSAYDAAYLVLAERLGAELWTADRKLVRNARALGRSVRFIGELDGEPAPE